MPERNEENSIKLPLRSRFIYETDDLIATRDHLARFLGRHTINPLEKPYRVSFQHCGINIGRVGVNALHYGTAIRIGVRPPENTFFMLVLLRGKGSVKQAGNTTYLSANNAFVFNPGAPAVLDLSGDMMNFTVKLSRPALTQFLERESGKSLSPELLFKSSEAGRNVLAHGLSKLLVHACNEIDEGHINIRLPLIEKQWENLIYAQILVELPHNHAEIIGMEAPGAVPEYVRRVEDYIADNYQETVHLSDLAGCAVISERALQNGFRRFRDTTPMEYLRDYRLHLSRQKLLDDKYSERTIAEIATDCGFAHLSKFAKCYRQRFAESPSATRKKIT